VEMSGQQKIDAASQKAVQGSPRTAGKVPRLIAWRQIEGVMGYHDLLDAIGKPAELIFHPEHLPVIDAAAFDDQPPGRIDAGNRDFGIEVEGLQVIGNELLKDVEPLSKPGVNVVQRNVMIPRHDDLRGWKRPQERADSFELARPGALGEVARDGHYVRLDLTNGIDELPDDSVIRSAEVEIGKMD
jgi:hypothetical protein